MKIIHLSDLHLNAIYKQDNIKKLQYALRHAVNIEFDHLVISGDIADNADEKEFLILRKLLNKYNLLDSKLVSMVIGNHDIFGGVQTALDVVDFPKKCKAADYDVRVNDFISYFEELFIDITYPDRSQFFPFVKIIDNHAFIGMNSIDRYSTLKNPFASNGKVYDDQIELLKTIFDLKEVKKLKKVILIHHHFYKKNVESTASQNNIWNKIESFTMKLRGKKQLIKLFKENEVELVLHGHSHEIKDYTRKGIRFLNAGASIDNGSEKAHFFVIDSQPHAISVKLGEIHKSTFNPISIKLPKTDIPKFITNPAN